MAPENVRTFTNEDDVSNCQKIALLGAKGEQSEEKMIDMLCKTAGELGANALLILESKVTTLKDVIVALPETLVAGTLGMDAKPPPARYVNAAAYHCLSLD